MSIPASTIRNEFQGFMQKLGPPAQDMNEPGHHEERKLSNGDTVEIYSGAQQYTFTLPKHPRNQHPYTCTDDGCFHDPVAEERYDRTHMVSEPGGPLRGDLLVMTFPPNDEGGRSVYVKYKKDGESLTRDVVVVRDGHNADNELVVGPGDTVAREVSGRSETETSLDEIVLTPDEKAILGEWNLTSLA